MDRIKIARFKIRENIVEQKIVEQYFLSGPLMSKKNVKVSFATFRYYDIFFHHISNVLKDTKVILTDSQQYFEENLKEHEKEF